MFKTFKVLAVVPARKGSKGISEKNVRLVGGVPLLGIAIRHASESRWVDTVLLSTDSQEYAEIGRSFGAAVPFLRPANLSGDNANPVDAVLHLVDHLPERTAPDDLIVLVEPTSPLREPGLIDRAVEKLGSDDGLSSVVSVSVVNTTHPEYLFTKDATGRRLRKLFDSDDATGGRYVKRQDLEDLYFLDGNVYVARLRALRGNRSFLNADTGFIVSKEGTSLEIDTMADLICAEALYDALAKGRLK